MTLCLWQNSFADLLKNESLTFAHQKIPCCSLFCDKEALSRESQVAMQQASSKKECKAINKEYDRRRAELEEQMRELVVS